LIPLCHQIALDYVKLKFEWNDAESMVTVICESQVTDKTGCEMEALTGATVASLTLYDMCKSIDKRIEIVNTRLVSKQGGKSGDFVF